MAGTVKKNKGGKKARKYGRNTKICAYYKVSNAESINRLRKMRRHLREKRHANDKVGLTRYIELGGKQNLDL